ncbi:MAG: heme-binding protein [Acidimicrobiia bacterium]|nr:heme-binding protein [Acidimicrobiia bacterium]NNL28132.1 heme-binding protein [Acidimicrobiia bacterium]
MSRYEQPEYEVVAEGDRYEIRRYRPYLVAETTVVGDADSAGSVAFRRLAGFIFGGNSAEQKMNMTIPVTRQAVGEDRQRYRFVMERSFSESDLPQPLDDTVTIIRVPGGYYAARRYRGNRDERRFRRMEAALLEDLGQDGIEIAGAAQSAVYSGPMTPPMLRHNEVLIPVDWDSSAKKQTST